MAYVSIALLLLVTIVPNATMLPLYLAREDLDVAFNGFEFSVGLLGFAAVTTALPLVFCKRFKHFFFIYAPLAIISPAIFVSMYRYGSYLNDGLVISLFSTNWRELRELMHMTGVVALAPILVIALYAVSVRRTPFLQREVPHKLKRAVLWISLPYVLFCAYYVDQVYFKSADSGSWVTPDTFFESYPFGMLLKTGDALTSVLDQRDYIAFSHGAVHVNESNEPQTYVLVIGESSRYDHWQIHGYQRQTTPNLARLAQPELISFSDFAAGANFTVHAMPQILTGLGAGQYKETFKRKSVVAAFREAGFATFWISNQERFLKFSKEAFNESYPAQHHDKDNPIHDAQTLTAIEAWLQKTNSPKRFIVVHTLGSHVIYTDRYPQQFRRFTPDEIKRKDIRKDRIPFVNAYDNTIFYTDHYLAQLIALLKKRDERAALIYVSDHGQNLVDDERQLVTHGLKGISKAETHIPFLVWTSSRYRDSAGEKVLNLANNAAKKASQTNVLPTLLDLADISTRVNWQTRSLASAAYIAPQQREVLLPDRRLGVYEQVR